MLNDYEQRQPKKHDIDAYRAVAKAIYEAGNIRIPQYAHVHPCHDGAFVEAVIWIPKPTD